ETCAPGNAFAEACDRAWRTNRVSGLWCGRCYSDGHSSSELPLVRSSNRPAYWDDHSVLKFGGTAAITDVSRNRRRFVVSLSRKHVPLMWLVVLGDILLILGLGITVTPFPSPHPSDSYLRAAPRSANDEGGPLASIPTSFESDAEGFRHPFFWRVALLQH